MTAVDAPPLEEQVLVGHPRAPGRQRAAAEPETDAAAAWQSGQMPQNVTSASSITKSARRRSA